MSIICSKCGKELADEAKYCGGCGNKIVSDVPKINCPQCGKELPATAKFCNGCGTKLNKSNLAEDIFNPKPVAPVVAEPAKPEAVTMDSLELPTDLDEALAPKPKVEKPKPAVSTPVQPVANPQPVQQAPIQPAIIQEQAQPAYNQQTPPAQPYVPQYQPNPVPQNAEPIKGKGASALVPVILIILILAVIAVDVFVLFPDKIFGGDDSSSKEIATVIDVDTPTNF